mgnify:CR=1 FL=1
MPEKMKEGLPKVQPVVASKIIEAQRLLEEVVMYPYYGLTLTGETLKEFMFRVKNAVLPAGDIGAIAQSCIHLAGRPFSREQAKDVAWRIAGNLDRLKGKRGIAPRPVPPWTGQCEKEWVLAEVIGSSRGLRKFKPKQTGPHLKADGLVHKHGAELTFRIMSGPPAGKQVTKFWSFDMCAAMKVHFGFDRFDRAKYNSNHTGISHPYQDSTELFGMRIQVLLDPAKCTPDLVHFDEVYGTSSTIGWNRTLMEKRQRVDYKCPKKFSDSLDCYRCHIGRNECEVAVRPLSLIELNCSMCGAKTRVEPEKADVCTTCKQTYS